MIGEAGGELHRVRRRGAHAQVERPQAPGQKERLERMQDQSVRLADGRARAAQRVVARKAERARDDVGMPVEIFGRRMHDDVGAERERPGEDRRRAGRVDRESAPAAWAARAAPSMSLTPQSGLLGVSSQTSFVAPGFSAAASACKSSASTKSTLSPKAGASLASQARSAQYMPLGATTWAPGPRLRKRAIAADMPEPKTSVADAPSSAPIRASASRTVSLSGRP